MVFAGIRAGIKWKMNRRPEIVPKNRAENYPQRNTDAWKRFARRIQKNPFIKDYIVDRDGNICQWCMRSCRGNIQIHHIDYEHICSFSKILSLPSKRSGGLTGVRARARLRHLPHCELCSKENPEGFAGCVSRLVLTHPMCNAAIDAFTPEKNVLSQQHSEDKFQIDVAQLNTPEVRATTCPSAELYPAPNNGKSKVRNRMPTLKWLFLILCGLALVGIGWAAGQYLGSSRRML